MNTLKRILPLLALAVAAAWFWPAPRPRFEKIYAAVPAEAAAALTAFRKDTPSKRVKVDGRVWNYLSVGNGPGTILFLHGMTGAYDIWWRQIEAFKGEYRVVAVTYPAAGSLAALEKGVLAVLDAEGVKDFHVVGTSLGGYFAQYLVARHPDRVKKAVFANTFPPNDFIRKKNGTIGGLIPFLPERLVMQVLRGSFVERVYPASGNDEFTLAFLNEMGYGRMSKAQVAGRYRCAVERFEPARDTKTPILIIEADNDPLVEKALRDELKRTYPRAAAVAVSNGHFPYLGTPERFNRTIADFLREN